MPRYGSTTEEWRNANVIQQVPFPGRIVAVPGSATGFDGGAPGDVFGPGVSPILDGGTP